MLSRFFQLRWEAYNTFNHTQYSGINTSARFDLTTGALAFVGCVSSDAATTGCGTGNINTATNALNGPQDGAVAA